MNIHTIAQMLGGTYRNGRGQAPCPICQPERRRDQTALSIREGNSKLLLHCFKDGCNFVEIANAVELPLGDVQIDFEAQREREAKQAAYSVRKFNSARDLWNHATSIAGTKTEQYLRARGITCDLPDTLRHVPDLYHAPSASRCMAMVANVEPAGGVHRTFFDKQGNRLAKNAKMMLGPCSGRAVRLSGSRGPLVVCEGIETGLALLSGLLVGPATVWAALSTSGIKGLSLPLDPHRLIIATDGDDPGKEAGDNLAMKATALGWDVSLLPAPNGTDWADILVKRGNAA